MKSNSVYSLENQHKSRNTEIFDVTKMSEIIELDKSSWFMLTDRLLFVMNTQESFFYQNFFHSTKQNYSTLQVSKFPEVERNAKSLTLLQRNKTFTETSRVDKK